MTTPVLTREDNLLLERQSLLDAINVSLLALAGTPDLPVALQGIVEQVIQFSGVQAAECHLHGLDGRERLTAHVGVLEEHDALRRHARNRLRTMLGQQRAPLVIADLATDSDAVLRELAEKTHFASLVYVPLWLTTAANVGYLVLYGTAPRVLSRGEQLLLQTFARQIATGVKAAVDRKQEAQRNALIRHAKSLGSSLGRVAITIQAARTEDELLSLLTTSLRKMGLMCAVFVGEGDDRLRLRATSVAPAAIRAMEKLQTVDLSALIERIPEMQWLQHAREKQAPLMMHNVQRYLQPWMKPGQMQRLQQALWLAGITDRTELVLLPVLVEGSQDGIVLVWGRGLSVAMMPELSIFGAHVTQVWASVRLLERVEAAQARLRDLTRQLINVEEEERARISRQLHDEVGQALAALKIQLYLLHKAVASDQQSLVGSLQRSIDSVGQLVRQMRSLSHEVHPPALADLGLNAALEECCLTFAQNSDLTINYRGMPAPAVSREIGITLYRFLQEALTNVTRHANAKSVTVLLIATPSALSLSVRDDGAGFDTQQLRAGLGLRSIRERLQLISGQFEIESQPGKGTALTARVPVAEMVES